MPRHHRAVGASPSQAFNGLYRTIWRWHFYAGLIVSPFLLILAVTGAIYLFNTEINDALYPNQRFVAETAPLPASRLIGAALEWFPGGTATRIDMPVEPGRSALLFITPTDGPAQRVYVDPDPGWVCGRLSRFSDNGDRGDAIVELMACWGLILVVTGLYLWWPRSARSWVGVAVFNPMMRGRMFWRDIHAVVGIWTALLIAFLILTGLPWATVWGGLLKGGVDALGVGYPANHRLHGATPTASRASNAPPPPSMVEAIGEAPWTMENAPMPTSDLDGGLQGPRGAPEASEADRPIGVDGAIAALNRAGMTSAYRLSLPQGPDGVYTAYTYPSRPQGQRPFMWTNTAGAFSETFATQIMAGRQRRLSSGCSCIWAPISGRRTNW
ncbi:hypothetical protein LTR94_024393 [Friedmanniomyces endolithicus]|nr:hypothetical protein LTR94_024393 [Friedmanniomyces endolithicus]